MAARRRVSALGIEHAGDRQETQGLQSKGCSLDCGQSAVSQILAHTDRLTRHRQPTRLLETHTWSYMNLLAPAESSLLLEFQDLDRGDAPASSSADAAALPGIWDAIRWKDAEALSTQPTQSLSLADTAAHASQALMIEWSTGPAPVQSQARLPLGPLGARPANATAAPMQLAVAPMHK